MPVRGGRLAATAAALRSFIRRKGARGGQDESSPFNECSHAYLAATRALLLHLQTMPGDCTAVRTLIAKIEREMLNNNASLVIAATAMSRSTRLREFYRIGATSPSRSEFTHVRRGGGAGCWLCRNRGSRDAPTHLQCMNNKTSSRRNRSSRLGFDPRADRSCAGFNQRRSGGPRLADFRC